LAVAPRVIKDEEQEDESLQRVTKTQNWEKRMKKIVNGK